MAHGSVLKKTHVRHARGFLSGIHVFIIPGFPPEECGNDSVIGIDNIVGFV